MRGIRTPGPGGFDGRATDLHQQRKALEAERRGLEDRLRRQYEFIETGDGDFMAEDRTFARRYLQLLLDKVVVDGKVIHVHAKAAGVMQVAVTKKDEADEVVTPSASVPTSVMSRLKFRLPYLRAISVNDHVRQAPATVRGRDSRRAVRR